MPFLQLFPIFGGEKKQLFPKNMGLFLQLFPIFGGEKNNFFQTKLRELLLIKYLLSGFFVEICYVYHTLFQIFSEELLQLVVGYEAGTVVVEIGVDGAGDDEDLLVADGHALAVAFLAGHLLECCLAEVEAVGILAVD